MYDRDEHSAEPAPERLERARQDVWEAFTHGRLDEDTATARLLSLACEERLGRPGPGVGVGAED